MLRQLVLSLAVLFAGAGSVADTPSTPSGLIERPPVWAPKGGEQVRFKVRREGKPFGYHNIDFFREADGALRVENDVHFRAGLGPISLYSYRHRSTERWAEGYLTYLEGQTRKSGKDFEVSAQANDDGIAVDGTLNMGLVAADLVPFSHWNVRQVEDVNLLSSESGELIPIRMERIGRDLVQVDGVAVPATRFRMNSELVADLWYDDTGRWVKFAFTARGNDIEYILTELY